MTRRTTTGSRPPTAALLCGRIALARQILTRETGCPDCAPVWRQARMALDGRSLEQIRYADDRSSQRLPWATDMGAERQIAGRVYLLDGQPVTVLLGWGPGGGPRNVRIRFADGSTTIRPFRGLRRIR